MTSLRDLAKSFLECCADPDYASRESLLAFIGARRGQAYRLLCLARAAPALASAAARTAPLLRCNALALRAADFLCGLSASIGPGVPRLDVETAISMLGSGVCPPLPNIIRTVSLEPELMPKQQVLEQLERTICARLRTDPAAPPFSASVKQGVLTLLASNKASLRLTLHPLPDFQLVWRLLSVRFYLAGMANRGIVAPENCAGLHAALLKGGLAELCFAVLQQLSEACMRVLTHQASNISPLAKLIPPDNGDLKLSFWTALPAPAWTLRVYVNKDRRWRLCVDLQPELPSDVPDPALLPALCPPTLDIQALLWHAFRQQALIRLTRLGIALGVGHVRTVGNYSDLFIPLPASWAVPVPGAGFIICINLTTGRFYITLDAKYLNKYEVGECAKALGRVLNPVATVAGTGTGTGAGAAEDVLNSSAAKELVSLLVSQCVAIDAHNVAESLCGGDARLIREVLKVAGEEEAEGQPPPNKRRRCIVRVAPPPALWACVLLCASGAHEYYLVHSPTCMFVCISLDPWMITRTLVHLQRLPLIMPSLAAARQAAVAALCVYRLRKLVPDSEPRELEQQTDRPFVFALVKLPGLPTALRVQFSVELRRGVLEWRAQFKSSDCFATLCILDCDAAVRRVHDVTPVILPPAATHAAFLSSKLMLDCRIIASSADAAPGALECSFQDPAAAPCDASWRPYFAAHDHLTWHRKLQAALADFRDACVLYSQN